MRFMALRGRFSLFFNAREINRYLPKKSENLFFSYSFWSTVLKLGSHVLGTKNKLPIYQNFDLGVMGENIEFWKWKICIFNDFWRVDIFKVQYFHFWGLN